MKNLSVIFLISISFVAIAEVDDFDICKNPESKCLAVSTEVQIDKGQDKGNVKFECDEVSYTTAVEKVRLTAYYHCKLFIKGESGHLVIRVKEAKPWKKYQDFTPATKPTM